MSEKEYKKKCENLFQKNTILINENEKLKNINEELKDFVQSVYEINADNWYYKDDFERFKKMGLIK